MPTYPVVKAPTTDPTFVGEYLARCTIVNPMTHHPPSPGASYAHGHHTSVLASHAARTAENSCAYLLAHLHAGMALLDIGCGPGTITLDLAAHLGPRSRVVGVDFAPEAIEAAKRNARQRGDQRTEFIVADLFDLALPAGSFDVVHAHQVLQHLTDPVAGLQAMASYLRPGGLVAVREADYGAMAWFPPNRGISRWHETYCASARASGSEPDAGRHLRAWVRRAGLRIESISSANWLYADRHATRWWGNSQAERVGSSQFHTRALAAGLTERELADIARQWRAWGENAEASFLIPNTEIIARTH